MSSSLQSIFLLTAELLLTLLPILPELSAERSDFNTAIGRGSWTPTPLISLPSKSLFFLLGAGTPLLLQPVMLGV